MCIWRWLLPPIITLLTVLSIKLIPTRQCFFYIPLSWITDSQWQKCDCHEHISRSAYTYVIPPTHAVENKSFVHTQRHILSCSFLKWKSRFHSFSQYAVCFALFLVRYSVSIYAFWYLATIFQWLNKHLAKEPIRCHIITRIIYRRWLGGEQSESQLSLFNFLETRKSVHTHRPMNLRSFRRTGHRSLQQTNASITMKVKIDKWAGTSIMLYVRLAVSWAIKSISPRTTLCKDVAHDLFILQS